MALRIFAPTNYKKTMVFLHGLGDTADGFYSIFQQIQIPGWRVVLPTAPSRPITINMGMSMPAWYDIKTLDRKNFELGDDAIESGKTICKLIDEYDANVVGGFSMGGAMSLLCAYNLCERKLDGVVGLSSYALPFEKKRELPTFLYHGLHDPMVPYALASESYEQVLGIKDIPAEKNLDHSVSPTEMDELTKFLEELN